MSRRPAVAFLVLAVLLLASSTSRAAMSNQPLPAPAVAAPAVAAPAVAAPGTAPFGIAGVTSPAQAQGTIRSILYAPSDADDPAYRAAIAAITGGVVDYFDARSGTPSALTLASYSAVYTYAMVAYSDRALMGDRLADFVDAGGKVILGAYCTYTTGFPLGGRIMTSAYSPVVSPTGTNHHTSSPYAGDGTTSLHAGVLAYSCNARDYLALQGAGVVDGHYADGEIALAYRPDGRVVYVNGAGAVGFAATGSWPQIIANAAMGSPAAPAMLFAPAANDDPQYRADIAVVTGGPVTYFNANAATPSAPLLATYDCVYTTSGMTYFDRTLFGNRLADFVDAGGKLILGVGTVYNAGASDYSLGGRLRGPGYCPVNELTGALHPGPAVGSLGDGTTCIHAAIGPYSCGLRDRLFTQGAGRVAGHYVDGEIAVAYRPDGKIIYLNGSGAAGYGGSGPWASMAALACVCAPGSGPRVLYAPSDADDPALRALLATYTGGAVDYFDAATGTPAADLLASYDCVYTWPNVAYSDAPLFGDRLADYVDNGGKVVLGAFTASFAAFRMNGRIMTPAYAPVYSPLLDNHRSLSAYAGDGTTRLHHGVLAYDCSYRDYLALQGAGRVDGHYADGEIAVAYRPDRRVFYMNGGPGISLEGTGDWAMLLANLAAAPVPAGSLFASSTDGRLFWIDTETGASTLLGPLPTAAATEIEIDEATSRAWVQASDGGFYIQQFGLTNGAPASSRTNDYGSYPGLEFALGRLYGACMTSPDGPSDLAILDPYSGTAATVGPTGFGPISGLAFEPVGSTMLGVTSGSAGAHLVRMDLTSGTANDLFALVPKLGGFEFGPGGDLFGGGNSKEGGNLYRVNPSTGALALVGSTGIAVGITGLAYAPPGVVAVAGSPRMTLGLAAAPNPSRDDAVRISFTLPAGGDAVIDLYDVSGRRVWEKPMPGAAAGAYVVSWNGRTSGGVAAAAGVYFLRLRCPAGTTHARIVRL